MPVTFWFFMETPISGSAFEAALKSAVSGTPPEKRQELPLGILMLERDGTMSSFHVAEALEDSDDLGAALLALDYVLYAFERADWMIEFVDSIDRDYAKLKKDKLRASLTVIPGGLAEEQKEPREEAGD